MKKWYESPYYIVHIDLPLTYEHQPEDGLKKGQNMLP